MFIGKLYLMIGPSAKATLFSVFKSRNVMRHCYLFQACRSCIKKVTCAIQTSGQVTSVENIQQLDEMADEVLRTSPR